MVLKWVLNGLNSSKYVKEACEKNWSYFSVRLQLGKVFKLLMRFGNNLMGGAINSELMRYLFYTPFNASRITLNCLDSLCWWKDCQFSNPFCANVLFLLPSSSSWKREKISGTLSSRLRPFVISKQKMLRVELSAETPNEISWKQS